MHFSMVNKTSVLSREQSHGNPSMHEPQSRMMNIHVMRLKLANYILTQNYSPKFVMIKTLISPSDWFSSYCDWFIPQRCNTPGVWCNTPGVRLAFGTCIARA
jgi:hypothetical protein